MRPRSCLKVCVCSGAFLAALSGSVGARADEPPVAPARTLAEGPNDEKMGEARRQFEAGVSLLEDPDGAKYEDAYRAFKRAYELSLSPKVLGNIAFCALHLERDGEAVDSYTSYLRDVPDISERERSQIQRDLATMMATMSRVRVVAKLAAKGAVVVDRRTQTRGQVVENAYALDGNELLLRLRPGRHTLFVKSGTAVSAPFETTLEPGAEVSFTPQEPVQPKAESGPAVASSSGSLTGPIVVGAVGIAAIGVGAVTGIVARSKTSDIEKSCPNDTCPTTFNLSSARTSAKTFGTVADVSFIGGGALIGGAVIWYLLTPKSPSSPQTTGSTASWRSLRPTAMCSPTGCGFDIGGGF